MNEVIAHVFQHHDVTECVRPMFERILELQECEDDTLQRDASNIVSMLGSNIAELMGDRLEDVVDEFIKNPDIQGISECINQS